MFKPNQKKKVLKKAGFTTPPLKKGLFPVFFKLYASQPPL